MLGFFLQVLRLLRLLRGWKSFSCCFAWSRSFDVVFFSPARTTPSCKASSPAAIAATGYPLWQEEKRPVGLCKDADGRTR